MPAANIEMGGEFIAIGKGAIAKEAIDQQLAADPTSSLRLVQGSDSVLKARGVLQDGRLYRDIDLAPIPGLRQLQDIGSFETTDLLSGVKFALEATPYSSHEEVAELVAKLSQRGIFTVMASKGFMAEHPEEALELYQQGYLGIDATLGGNTGIFPMFENEVDARTISFEGVVNGTYSRMFNLMRAGMTAEQIVSIVKPRTPDNPKGEGLAEPQAETLLEVLHGEHEDNLGKAVNAFNFGVMANMGTEIDTSELARIGEAEITEISQEQADELFADPEEMAYVVNYHKDGDEIPEEYYDPSRVAGVLKLEVGASGLIVGSFRKVPQSSPMHVITQRSGPLNGMAVTSKIKPVGRGGRDTNVVIGTGAGPIPTARRMVSNVKRLRELYAA